MISFLGGLGVAEDCHCGHIAHDGTIDSCVKGISAAAAV